MRSVVILDLIQNLGVDTAYRHSPRKRESIKRCNASSQSCKSIQSSIIMILTNPRTPPLWIADQVRNDGSRRATAL